MSSVRDESALPSVDMDKLDGKSYLLMYLCHIISLAVDRLDESYRPSISWINEFDRKEDEATGEKILVHSGFKVFSIRIKVKPN